MSENINPLSKLQWVMQELLSPHGCPWDKEQTAQSLAPYAIEEAHELAESLEKSDWEGVKEELGDFLFQVVFQCALAEKEGRFTFADVCHGISDKLVRRHPHVFANAKVKDSDEVLKNWSEIKKQEGKNKNGYFNIPPSLPALQRAQKIGEKTKQLKFDWNTPEEVLTKVDEEVVELKEALQKRDLKNAAEEMGDVFFVLAQLSRHLKMEAESLARGANRKFEARFEKMMALAKEKNLVFENLSSEQKEELWQEIKKQ